MRNAFASDHAGLPLKQHLLELLATDEHDKHVDFSELPLADDFEFTGPVARTLSKGS
jgi:hypothetical protein